MTIWHDFSLLVCWWHYYCFVVLVQISGLLSLLSIWRLRTSSFGAIISITGVHLAGLVKSAFPCISFLEEVSKLPVFLYISVGS